MNKTNYYHNPKIHGEGFSVFVYKNGMTWGLYYFIQNGSPVWMNFFGSKDKPIGISQIVNGNEVPWGEVRLAEKVNDKGEQYLEIRLVPLSGDDDIFTVVPIIDSELLIEGPVEPPPAAENVITGKVKVGTNWFDTGIPIEGHQPKNGSSIPVRKIVSEYEVTVVKGTLTITGTGHSGAFSPRVVGVKEGDKFLEGSVVKISMEQGPAAGEDGDVEYGNITVETEEHGRILNAGTQITFP